MSNTSLDLLMVKTSWPSLHLCNFKLIALDRWTHPMIKIMANNACLINLIPCKR